MNRPKGIHSKAFDAYIAACFAAQVSPERIVQTLGQAAASHGTHGRDGSFTNEQGNTEAYSAAVDLSVKHPRLLVCEREEMLRRLWANGFAAWYRQAPEFPNNEHCHCIYVALPMKRSLRDQVHMFLAHRSGLVSERADQFVADNLTDAVEQKLRLAFLSHNPMNG